MSLNTGGMSKQWQNKLRKAAIKNKISFFKISLFPFLVLLGYILTPLFENPKNQQALKNEFLSILSACDCQMTAVQEHFQGISTSYWVTVTTVDSLAQEQVFYKMNNALINNGWSYMGWSDKTQYYCKNSVAFGFYKFSESSQMQVALRKSPTYTKICH